MVVASSPALESAPAVTTELSVHRGLDAPGAGLLICSARGRSVLDVLCPPGLCLSRGSAGSWVVSPVPCAPGPALLESLSAAPPPQHGAAARAASEVFPADLRVLQSFRELGCVCGCALAEA